MVVVGGQADGVLGRVGAHWVLRGSIVVVMP
jgi:hypothetical protein